MNHSDNYHYKDPEGKTESELGKEILEQDFNTFMSIITYFILIPALALSLMKILLSLYREISRLS